MKSLLTQLSLDATFDVGPWRLSYVALGSHFTADGLRFAAVFRAVCQFDGSETTCRVIENLPVVLECGPDAAPHSAVVTWRRSQDGNSTFSQLEVAKPLPRRAV